jgi:hypothetical protein
MGTLLGLTFHTGMRLGWGLLDSPLGGPHGRWSAVLRAMAPTGALCGVDLSTVHVSCAWLLLLNAGIYPGYMCRAKASRRLRMTGTDLGTLGRVIRTGGFERNTGALWSANLLISGLAFTVLAGLAVTGVAAQRVPVNISAPVLDSDPTDPAWHDAQAVPIRTARSPPSAGPCRRHGPGPA